MLNIYIYLFISQLATVLTKILFEVYVCMHFSNSTSKSNGKHMSYAWIWLSIRRHNWYVYWYTYDTNSSR